ncbi:MAG: heparin lyase I family protein [Polyangiaceae bacterium]
MTRLLVAQIALVSLSACSTRSKPEEGRPHLDHPRSPRPFAEDFELGTLSRWSVEGSVTNLVSVTPDPTSPSNRVASMHVEPGELVNAGSRAEIAYDNRDVPGTVAWYRWRFLVPSDYTEPHDTTGTDDQGRPMWQVMGQWHDQPNVEAGESWDSYPGHSPAISAHHGTVNGRSSLVTIIGVAGRERTLGPVELVKGKWHELLWHIGWSTGDDAFVAVWLDGVALSRLSDGTVLPVVENEARVRGRNMWNAYPHYLKLGLYRNASFTAANTVYYDDVTISAAAPARKP